MDKNRGLQLNYFLFWTINLKAIGFILVDRGYANRLSKPELGPSQRELDYSFYS
jgi:hypothetical protein